jgi:hypothetical protein
VSTGLPMLVPTKKEIKDDDVCKISILTLPTYQLSSYSHSTSERKRCMYMHSLGFIGKL